MTELSSILDELIDQQVIFLRNEFTGTRNSSGMAKHGIGGKSRRGNAESSSMSAAAYGLSAAM